MEECCLSHGGQIKVAQEGAGEGVSFEFASQGTQLVTAS